MIDQEGQLIYVERERELVRSGPRDGDNAVVCNVLAYRVVCRKTIIVLGAIAKQWHGGSGVGAPSPPGLGACHNLQYIWH